MATVQISDCTIRLVVLWPANSCWRTGAGMSPRVSERTELMTRLTGWWSAKPRSHVGRVAVGTKALLAKVSGKMTGKVAALTVCTLLANSPTSAKMNDVDNAKPSRSSSPSTSPPKLCGR